MIKIDIFWIKVLLVIIVMICSLQSLADKNKSYHPYQPILNVPVAVPKANSLLMKIDSLISITDISYSNKESALQPKYYDIDIFNPGSREFVSSGIDFDNCDIWIDGFQAPDQPDIIIKIGSRKFVSFYPKLFKNQVVYTKRTERIKEDSWLMEIYSGYPHWSFEIRDGEIKSAIFEYVTEEHKNNSQLDLLDNRNEVVEEEVSSPPPAGLYRYAIGTRWIVPVQNEIKQFFYTLNTIIDKEDNTPLTSPKNIENDTLCDNRLKKNSIGKRYYHLQFYNRYTNEEIKDFKQSTLNDSLLIKVTHVNSLIDFDSPVYKYKSDSRVFVMNDVSTSYSPACYGENGTAFKTLTSSGREYHNPYANLNEGKIWWIYYNEIVDEMNKRKDD